MKYVLGYLLFMVVFWIVFLGPLFAANGKDDDEI